MAIIFRRIAKSSNRLFFIAIVGLAACNPSMIENMPTFTPLSSTPTQSQIPTSTPIYSDEFLRVKGQALTYKGQIVYLRGTNFNNAQALKIRRTDAYDWGDGDTGDINYSEADYERLSEMGGNHVRWGISFNWYKDDRDKFFQVLDQHIVWSKKYNLWLLPVLYTFPDDCYEGYTYSCPYWDEIGLQQEVLDFWVDVASRYKDESVIAGYDLLNEPTPTGPNGSSKWFPIAQKIRDAIYQVDPNHLVFVESDSSGKRLMILEGNNIVYSIHMYSPFKVTHAEAPTDITYPGFIPENGSLIWWDKSAMAREGNYRTSLKSGYGIGWAEKNNLPLYIGEFGTKALVDGHLQYLKDIFDLFNSWNLHYAHFVWRSTSYEGFGIYPMDDSLVPWDKEREEVVSSKLSGSFRPDFRIDAGETPP